MEAKKLSLDELFESQNRPNIKCTIEESNQDTIKITPYIKDSGCLCGYNLVIPRSSIDHVIATGEVHDCCSRSHLVVQVYFKTNASILFVDLFSQIITNIKSSHQHTRRFDPFEYGGNINYKYSSHNFNAPPKYYPYNYSSGSTLSASGCFPGYHPFQCGGPTGQIICVPNGDIPSCCSNGMFCPSNSHCVNCGMYDVRCVPNGDPHPCGPYSLYR